MLSYIDIEAFATANDQIYPKRHSKPKSPPAEQCNLDPVSRPQTQQQMAKRLEASAQGSSTQQMS